MDFPGLNGFLGTRASIMLDLVFLAMFAVVPALFWSIRQARRGRYALHKRVQLALGLVLGAAIVLFEVDMRFVSGWRDRAEPSPYFASVDDADAASKFVCVSLAGMDRVPGWVFRALAIHLVFAVSTAVLWTWTTVRAWQRFPNPPAPNDYSPTHRRLGLLAAIDMTLTAVTGWIFYWLAFVA